MVKPPVVATMEIAPVPMSEATRRFYDSLRGDYRQDVRGLTREQSEPRGRILQSSGAAMYMMLAPPIAQPVQAPMSTPMQALMPAPTYVPRHVQGSVAILPMRAQVKLPASKGTKRKIHSEEMPSIHKKILLTDILAQPISSALVNLQTHWKFPNLKPLMEPVPLENQESSLLHSSAIDISVKKRKGREEIQEGVLRKKSKSFDPRQPDLFEPPFSYKGVRKQLPVAPEHWRDIAPSRTQRVQRVYTPKVNVDLMAINLLPLNRPFHYDDPYDRLSHLIPKLSAKSAHVFLHELRKFNENDNRIISGVLLPKKISQKSVYKSVISKDIQDTQDTPPIKERGHHRPVMSPMKIVDFTTSKMDRL